MRYHGDGVYQWDTWCIPGPDDVVHAFYLQQRRPGSSRPRSEADSLGHATSTNLIDWVEQPVIIAPNPTGQDGDLVNWTGSTVLAGETYHLFFTIRSSSSEGRVQAIGLATSPDLWTWTRHPEPVLRPDPRWYTTLDAPGPGGVVDCRDLMVVKHPTRAGWFGVFATRVAGRELPQGAVLGGAYSEDLVHWEQQPPVFRSARDAYSIVEMPDLFELDGRWYLTWLEDNSYGNRDVLGDPELTCGTVYAVADTVEGPYLEPEDNVLLASRGFNGISCRTVGLRGRTYVTYTSCERENENETKPTFGVLSLPKELRLVDGRPRLCLADLVLEQVTGTVIERGSRPAPARVRSTHETDGDWQARSGGWTGSVATAWARTSFEPVGSDVLASVRVTLVDGVAAGLLIRQVGTRGGVALLDVDRGTVSFCTVPRFQVVDARRWPLRRGREYLLRVIGNGEFVEVYLDDELVLQFVWYGERAGRFGLLVDRGTARFRELEVLALGDPATADQDR